MTDFVIYAISSAVFVGAAAAWYATRGTTVNRKVTMYAIVAVIFVLVLLSSRRRVPIISNIIDWFRDAFANSKIKSLEKDIDRLSKKKQEGTLSAVQMEHEAQKFREKAKVVMEDVKVLDKVIQREEKILEDIPDPLEVPESGSTIDDPIERSRMLLEKLKGM